MKGNTVLVPKPIFVTRCVSLRWYTDLGSPDVTESYMWGQQSWCHLKVVAEGNLCIKHETLCTNVCQK